MEELNVLSHGAGVQTSCMVYMCINGDLPKPDLIVFADPGWELSETYKYLEKLVEDVKKSGIPYFTASAGDLYADTVLSAETGQRAPSIPFYTDDEGVNGIVNRQCTQDYKISVVRKVAREFVGLEKGQRSKHRFVMWKGITTDEVERITSSKIKSERYKYPLFEKKMHRQDCMNYLIKNGHGIPPKSSCVGCPFHSRQHWVDIYKHYPEEFQKAVELDRIIRNHKKFKSKLYLHKDRMPLDEAVMRDSMQVDMFYDYEGFANDCSGSCGV